MSKFSNDFNKLLEYRLRTPEDGPTDQEMDYDAYQVLRDPLIDALNAVDTLITAMEDKAAFYSTKPSDQAEKLLRALRPAAKALDAFVGEMQQTFGESVGQDVAQLPLAQIKQVHRGVSWMAETLGRRSPADLDTLSPFAEKARAEAAVLDSTLEELERDLQ